MKFQKEIEVGSTAHEMFKHIAMKRGFKAKDSTKHQDIVEHIDLFLEKDGKIFTFDIKAKKKINRNDETSQDELVYVEFKNVKGKEGWLYGKAQFIAFETDSTFEIVQRKGLLEFCKKNVKKESVSRPADALYRYYRRNGRLDSMSLIRLNDIPRDIVLSWKKNLGD